MPATTPVAEPTVATAGAEDVHVPPVVAFVSVVVEEIQANPAPEMEAGNGLTVIILVETHSISVYETKTVPAFTPVRTPVVEFIDATADEPTLHVPPDNEEGTLIVALDPTQTVELPPIVATVFCTYNGVVLLQPDPKK